MGFVFHALYMPIMMNFRASVNVQMVSILLMASARNYVLDQINNIL